MKKSIDLLNLTFRQNVANDTPPYDLLLLADPSKPLVDAYLAKSEIFTADLFGETLGVIVLFYLINQEVEIKNLAVKPSLQGQGIGRFLIENVIPVAKAKQQKSIIIGTADSSLHQLNLYKKLGFEIFSIKRDFFTKNYPEPIIENGILAKDMLMLKREI